MDDNLSPDVYKKILIHEMTHAALALSGIAEYHMSDETEESVCVLMESAFEDIYEALRKYDDSID